MGLREIKIATCDDEELFLDEVTKMLEVFGNDDGTVLSVDKYMESRQLLLTLKKEPMKYDMYFLDIEMPKLNGIDLAREIRKMNEDAVICFVTSQPSHTREAYELSALGYIDKPYQYSAVKNVMRRAKAEIYYLLDEEEAKKRFIDVKMSRDTVTIDTDKILYIEKVRNKCVLHMTDTEYTCYDTLKNLFQLLNKEYFLFTHQGYIVNFTHVKEVKRDVVALSSKIEIPLSRRYQAVLRRRYMDKIRMLKAIRDNN